MARGKQRAARRLNFSCSSRSRPARVRDGQARPGAPEGSSCDACHAKSQAAWREPEAFSPHFVLRTEAATSLTLGGPSATAGGVLRCGAGKSVKA